MTVKVKHDQKGCIGCGACASVCPDNWVMTEVKGQTKSKPKKTELKDVGCNQEAADSCPVGVITVSDR